MAVTILFVHYLEKIYVQLSEIFSFLNYLARVQTTCNLNVTISVLCSVILLFFLLDEDSRCGGYSAFLI